MIKKGSKGDKVKLVQEFLGLTIDGDFGPETHRVVQDFQSMNGLVADGIVGPKTWDLMGLDSTDRTESSILEGDLSIEQYFLPKNEYKVGPTKKDYLFLHHTAGWHNPFHVVDQWGRDTRGTICTEFVIGGPSIKGNDDSYDGVVLQSFPSGGYGWHLGHNGSPYMHSHSVGIEVCNFGQLIDGKAWQGTRASKDQTVILNESFRGYKQWHKYSDCQLLSLKRLIEYIGNRDNINVRAGLPALVKTKGAKAFEFNADAFYGKVKGLWTHTNTRKDKFDMSPQPELIDLLNEI